MNSASTTYDPPVVLLLNHAELALRTVVLDGIAYVLASSGAERWPAELLRRGTVQVRQAGTQSWRTPRLETDPSRRELLLARFRAVYGPAKFSEWWPAPGRAIALEPTPTGTTRPDAYDRWLPAEFDVAAGQYEQRIATNPVERAFRQRSLALLRELWPPRPVRNLLEIGSGVGVETIPLLQAGHSVVAVDVSRAMLDELGRRADSAGVGGRLQRRVMRARDLARLEDEFGTGAFDGAYSTFGALNCEPALRPVAAALARLLRPGGRFVAAVFNRFSVAESALYLAAGRPARSFARLRSPVPVGRQRFSIDVFPYSFDDLAAAFAPHFGVDRVNGWGLILPPPELARWLPRSARGLQSLVSWDRRVGARWPWCRLGDHVAIVFHRRSGPEEGR